MIPCAGVVVQRWLWSQRRLQPAGMTAAHDRPEQSAAGWAFTQGQLAAKNNFRDSKLKYWYVVGCHDPLHAEQLCHASDRFPGGEERINSHIATWNGLNMHQSYFQWPDNCILYGFLNVSWQPATAECSAIIFGPEPGISIESWLLHSSSVKEMQNEHVIPHWTEG